MKVLVLNSWWLDSTVCLWTAIGQYWKDNVAALSIYYWQKHKREIEQARKIADYYWIKHIEKDLTSIFWDWKNSIVNEEKEIIQKSYKEQIREKEIIDTYVPFRNWVFISIATTVAFELFWEDEDIKIYLWAHIEDGEWYIYADCHFDFLEYLDKAVKIWTYNKVQLYCPFIQETKAEIVKRWTELKVPFNLTYSCYLWREKHCWKCWTCIDRKNAFKVNNIKDPTEYEF